MFGTSPYSIKKKKKEKMIGAIRPSKSSDFVAFWEERQHHFETGGTNGILIGIRHF